MAYVIEKMGHGVDSESKLELWEHCVSMNRRRFIEPSFNLANC